MRVVEYTPVSEDDYLALEAASPIRHAYVGGEIYAMTGGSLRHNLIAGNLFALLRSCDPACAAPRVGPSSPTPSCASPGLTPFITPM